MRNHIGFHLPLHYRISDTAFCAYELGIGTFQVFLMEHHNNHPFILTPSDEQRFLKLRNFFNNLYVHASYRINLANDLDQHIILEKELALAQRLQFTHYVLHPGVLKKNSERITGLHAIARNINKITVQYPSITILLENTPHKSRLLGSDLQELAWIKERIDYPERIGFCLDTSHAYAYGYPLHSLQEIPHFWNILDNTLKFKNIALIHLNDSAAPHASYIDQHTLPGQGTFNPAILAQLASHTLLQHADIIMEYPQASIDEMTKTLSMVKTWRLQP